MVDGWDYALCIRITNQASWWTPTKSLFYCYGCGRGGDVIRFAELYHQVKFPQALALLRQWRGVAPCCKKPHVSISMQLHRHTEAVAYLLSTRNPLTGADRAYADRLCARRLSARLADAVGSTPCAALRQAGLVTANGYDAYIHRIVFPLEGNLYGRSLSACGAAAPLLAGLPRAACMHGSKSDPYPEVILVEGLFDYAVLWQAGFHNVTCSMGTHLNAHQLRQLCDGPRTVYLAFDADGNGSGQQAAQCLSRSLRERGITTRVVSLPDGHDPNSYLCPGRRCASVPVACWRRRSNDLSRSFQAL